MKKITIIFTLILVFLSGCGHSREITDLEVVTGIGLEKAGDNYKVSIQVFNNSELGDKARGSSIVSTYSLESKSIFEAFRKMTSQTSRKIYAARMDILVIDEEIAKEGINDLLDFFMRDHEFGSNIIIILSKDATAEEILSITTPMEKNPLQRVKNSITINNEVYGSLVLYTLEDVLRLLIEPGISPVLSAFTIEGNKESMSKNENIESIEPVAILKGANMGVFDGDKLVGFLNETESIGYNFLRDNITSTAITVEYNDGQVALEVISNKTKTEVEKKDDQLITKIKVAVTGSIEEVSTNINLTDEKELEKIKKTFEKEVKKIVNSTIRASQQRFKSDIIGIGNLVYKKHPDYYQQFENDWNDEYQKLYIEVETTVEIKGIGLAKDPIKQDSE